MATTAATSGPRTGTISTMPANAPTSSQYGSPIAQKPAESTVPTMTMSTH